VLPPLPKDGGDRNRTSPFAFTGNKFEFRALGSSMSLAFPNTVLNTIVAEAIDDLSDKLEAHGGDVAEGVAAVVKESYSANKPICFMGDNYDDAWHTEAESRGLKNLRTTPDALPEVTAPETVAAFEKYDVLSERELEARLEVWVEQYATIANTEAETGQNIAKTMILPAAIRYLAILDDAEIDAVETEVRELTNDLVAAIRKLEEVNSPVDHEGLELAEYARDNQLTALDGVREIADKLERALPDDLWPLPKYSEILFVR
jgi:glutamine synthetase